MILLIEREELKQKKAQLINPCTDYVQGFFIGDFMRLVKLSSLFYKQYCNSNEILKKESRPYMCLEIRIDGVDYAVPLRHHIHHNYSFMTTNEAGLDYTKAVPIIDPLFLSNDTPWIDTNEWNTLKRNEKKIIYGFKKYLNQYKRAVAHPNNPRNANILKYSSLQYFNTK